MIRIVDQYVTKQLLLAAFVATVVFSGPVILISLFSHLPNENIFTELLWPALSSIAPMILYHTLPVLVAVAIVWCYGRFSSEGVLVTLHLTGQSIFRVRAPALYVATGATFVGYALSCVVVPLTAGHLHDVLYFMRHDINPAMLRAGKLNELEGGRLSIFFERFLDENELATVYIREIGADKEEKTFIAKRAVFARNPKQNAIILFDGSVQEFKPTSGEVRTAYFDQLSRPLITFGAANSKRPYVIVDELNTPRLLQERETAFGDVVEARSWTREVVKRLGIPALTIIHTLLGLELLAKCGALADRRRQPFMLACGIVASIHFAVVIAAEQVGLDLRWVWAVAAIIATELAAAVALMSLRPEAEAWLLRSITSSAYVLFGHFDGAPASARPGSYFRSVVGPDELALASGEHDISACRDNSEVVVVSDDVDRQVFAGTRQSRQRHFS